MVKAQGASCVDDLVTMEPQRETENTMCRSEVFFARLGQMGFSRNAQKMQLPDSVGDTKYGKTVKSGILSLLRCAARAAACKPFVMN
jgi:hypothetical protein